MTISDKEICPKCGGLKYVPSLEDEQITDVKCPECDGEGWVESEPEEDTDFG